MAQMGGSSCYYCHSLWSVSSNLCHHVDTINTILSIKPQIFLGMRKAKIYIIFQQNPCFFKRYKNINPTFPEAISALMNYYASSEHGIWIFRPREKLDMRYMKLWRGKLEICSDKSKYPFQDSPNILFFDIINETQVYPYFLKISQISRVESKTVICRQQNCHEKSLGRVNYYNLISTVITVY